MKLFKKILRSLALFILIYIGQYRYYYSYPFIYIYQYQGYGIWTLVDVQYDLAAKPPS